MPLNFLTYYINIKTQDKYIAGTGQHLLTGPLDSGEAAKLEKLRSWKGSRSRSTLTVEQGRGVSIWLLFSLPIDFFLSLGAIILSTISHCIELV